MPVMDGANISFILHNALAATTTAEPCRNCQQGLPRPVWPVID